MIYGKKNKLKLQIEFMKKNNYLISHTSYYIFNEKIKILNLEKKRLFVV